MAERLKPNNLGFMNLPWIRQTIQVLSKTFEDLKILIADLEIRGGGVRERWVTGFLDDTIKLLEVCNGLHADISMLNDSQLILICPQFLGHIMAAVFFCHVAGDLTVGKPELIVFPDSASVAEAIIALHEYTECGITVWKRRPPHLQKTPESAEDRQDRFLGILNALDIIAHLSTESSLMDPDAALKTPVSQILVPDNSLLRQIDPATRLVDALEMMKQGVKRLLVVGNFLLLFGMDKYQNHQNIKHRGNALFPLHQDLLHREVLLKLNTQERVFHHHKISIH